MDLLLVLHEPVPQEVCLSKILEILEGLLLLVQAWTPILHGSCLDLPSVIRLDLHLVIKNIEGIR